MKILIASDFHLGFTGHHKWHKEDIRQSLQYIADYAIKNDIRVFICGGDGLDRPSRLSNTDLLFLSKIINELKDNGISIYWIIGNHDLHTNPIMRIYPILVVSRGGIYKESPLILSNKTELLLIPYLCKGDVIPYKSYPKKRRTRIVVAHQLIEGTFTENSTIMRNMRDTERVFSAEEMSSLNPSMIFDGHIHTHTEYILGNIPVYLPGSTTIMSFGEIKTEHGFYVYDEDDNHVEYIPIPQRLWVDMAGLPENIESGVVYRINLSKEFKNRFHSLRDEFLRFGAEVFLKIERENSRRVERIEKITDMTDDSKLKAWLKYIGIEDITPYLIEHGRINDN